MGHEKSVLLPIGDSRSGHDVVANVVFVHGLGGDARETWQSDRKNPDSFWPQWLYEDLNKSIDGYERPVGVWSLGYPADVFRVLFFSKALDGSVPQRGRHLANLLVDHEFTKRPIIFIAHSLGGILVKQMLRSSSDLGLHKKDPKTHLAFSSRLVMFLATPHSGSSIARLAKVVEAGPALIAAGLLSTIDWLPMGKFLSVPVKLLAKFSVKRGNLTQALENDDPYLEDLGAWYRNNAAKFGISTEAYYENCYPPGLKIIIVDRKSANPGLTGVDPRLVEADHMSICKPEGRNEHYQSFIAPVRNLVKTVPVFKETHLAGLDVGQNFRSLRELNPADRMRAVKLIIQAVEKRLGRPASEVDYPESSGGTGEFVLDRWQEFEAEKSDYDLDRIILNVYREREMGFSRDDPTRSIRHETERLGIPELNTEKQISLIPLYYATRALKTQREKKELHSPKFKQDVERAIRVVDDLNSKFSEVDGNCDTRNVLKALLS